MTHERFLTLLDAAAEGTLTAPQQQAVREHALECAPCAALLAAREDLRTLWEGSEAPASFRAAWRQAIRKEAEEMEEHSSPRFGWKRWAAVAATAVFLVGGTLALRGSEYGAASPTPTPMMASGAQSKRSADFNGALYLTSESYDAGAPAAMTESAAADSVTAGYEQKIIRTASVTLATQAFEDDLQAVRDLTAQIGGRIQSLSLSGDASTGDLRRANMTIRVPSEQLDAFLAGAKGVGRVTAASENAEDVSEYYYDTQTRLDTQKAKLERLTALIATAADLSDLLELESAIADTQYQIDAYEGSLKSYDSRIDESTVNITLREETARQAADEKAVTLGERLQNALTSSLAAIGAFFKDMAVFVTVALPWLAVAAVAILIIRLLYKHNRKKKGN